jgi:hypothetical protein
MTESLSRVFIDGLAWCAGCHRAVDRGWEHDHSCPLLRFSRKQGCLYLRIPRNRWLVVHWWTKAVRP